MKYTASQGVYHLDFQLSKLEKALMDAFCRRLEAVGFNYLSVPSLINWKTLERQQVVDTTITKDKLVGLDDTHLLAGSAEQGILQYFADHEVPTTLVYAKNQCFRREDKYYDLVRCKEFIKIEQFCFFDNAEQWEKHFDFLLSNAKQFLADLGITYRDIDTTDDPGYHIYKRDIEILSTRYGWVETHSCSYFADEQTKRFNISGAKYTISNTGIASPRILLPFAEGSLDIDATLKRLESE